VKSFGFARDGLLYAVRTQRNMRIHLCFAFYIIWAGFVVKLTAPEWAVVLLCCGLVMGLECLNTALEQLCDRVCPERDEHIRIAKDAAAGAVLTSALFSAAAGCVLFFSGDRPEIALRWFLVRPAAVAALAVTLTAWMILIFYRRTYQ